MIRRDWDVSCAEATSHIHQQAETDNANREEQNGRTA